MFPKHHHYVPILKWKQGEQHALRDLALTAKARLTPLVEFVPVPTDPQTKLPKKTLAQHVSDGLDNLVKHWGVVDDVFLDPALASGSGGAQSVFAGAASRSLQFVPVTGLYRPPADVAAAVAHKQNGVCLRIAPDDLLGGSTLTTDITAFLATHSLKPQETDLVVDLGSVERKNTFFVQAAATAALGLMPNLRAWRTLTLAACAFPEQVGAVVKPNTTALIDRVEWSAWRAMHAQRGTLARLPTFGDYVIQNPVLMDDYDPRVVQLTAAIRYTSKAQWLIIRGVGRKKQALAAQFPVLARKLIASGHHYAAVPKVGPHCKGSGDAHACANNRPGFGSLTVWRRIGTVHHMEVVTADLATTAYP